jgi:hypothetical protein
MSTGAPVSSISMYVRKPSDAASRSPDPSANAETACAARAACAAMMAACAATACPRCRLCRLLSS